MGKPRHREASHLPKSHTARKQHNLQASPGVWLLDSALNPPAPLCVSCLPLPPGCALLAGLVHPLSSALGKVPWEQWAFSKCLWNHNIMGKMVFQIVRKGHISWDFYKVSNMVSRGCIWRRLLSKNIYPLYPSDWRGWGFYLALWTRVASGDKLLRFSHHYSKSLRLYCFPHCRSLLRHNHGSLVFAL